MKSKIYLETSLISYLTSRPSRDLIVAANQQITQELGYEPPIICTPQELLEE